MAQKKKAPEPDRTLVAVAKTIGSTVGTVAGALGITADRPTVPEAAKPATKKVSRLPRRQKKAAKKVLTASKSAPTKKAAASK